MFRAEDAREFAFAVQIRYGPGTRTLIDDILVSAGAARRGVSASPYGLSLTTSPRRCEEPLGKTPSLPSPGVPGEGKKGRRTVGGKNGGWESVPAANEA